MVFAFDDFESDNCSTLIMHSVEFNYTLKKGEAVISDSSVRCEAHSHYSKVLYSICIIAVKMIRKQRVKTDNRKKEKSPQKTIEQEKQCGRKECACYFYSK